RQHAAKGWIETGEALSIPGRKTPEQGRRRQRRRRSKGGRWVRRSEEAPVTRGDARLERSGVRGLSPGVQGGTAGRGTANEERHGGDDKDLYRCAETENADRGEGEGGTAASLLGPLHACVEARCVEGGVPTREGKSRCAWSGRSYVRAGRTRGCRAMARAPEPRAARQELRPAPMPACEHSEGGRQGQGPEDPGHP